MLRGISLVEMMVGIAIGVICVLIILQLLSAWEARKRTTTSGNDAQISGTLASFALDRDLRLAGYGFGTATFDVMGCSVTATNTARSPNDVTFDLRPVTITKGVNDAPDTITVLYGNSPYVVTSQALQASAAMTKKLKSREGIQIGDKVVVSGNTPTACQLVEVTGLSVAEATTIEHNAGETYTMLNNVARAATMNAAAGTGGVFTTGFVYDLGPDPVQRVWTVETTKGALTNYNRLLTTSDTAAEVASDVVTLKAQYGIDTSGNGEIEAGEWTDTTNAATNWTQVIAIRYGLLVRSRQFERPNEESGTVPVTATAPAWANGAVPFVMKNLDNTTDSGSSASAVAGATAANNWRNYRYRVYEAVVPLRNMIWGTAP